MPRSSLRSDSGCQVAIPPIVLTPRAALSRSPGERIGAGRERRVRNQRLGLMKKDLANQQVKPLPEVVRVLRGQLVGEPHGLSAGFSRLSGLTQPRVGHGKSCISALVAIRVAS